MKTKMYLLFVLTVLLALPTLTAQQESEAVSRTTNPLFVLKGSIFDIEEMKPVSRANVEITGGAYTTSRSDGEFRIQAKIGDELVIRSEDFETVFYTVKDRQRIRIEVRPLIENSSLKNRAIQSPKEARVAIESFLDEARGLYKNNAGAGIDKVAKALSVITITAKERADSFELLGDIYEHWKQYDLAINNYKKSLKNTANIAVEIKLAGAYYKNKNYQESIRAYEELSRKDLNSNQKIIVIERLGDAYAATGDYVSSITNYEEVEKQVIALKKPADAARLNTKIGDAYDQQGAPQAAALYFNEAVELSNLETSEAAVRAKTKVADYYSKKRSYDAEIELRKSTEAQMYGS